MQPQHESAIAGGKSAALSISVSFLSLTFVSRRQKRKQFRRHVRLDSRVIVSRKIFYDLDFVVDGEVSATINHICGGLMAGGCAGGSSRRAFNHAAERLSQRRLFAREKYESKRVSGATIWAQPSECCARLISNTVFTLRTFTD